MIYEIYGCGSLRLESEDNLYDFISKGIETDPEMFCLLEFVRFEYCSTEVMNDFFDLLSGHFCEIKASMWAVLCGRLIRPGKTWMPFPPSVKKGNNFDVPDGIIAHLTRECGGNVYDRHVVVVTCGSFEKETHGASAHSGAFGNLDCAAAKNASDLGATSYFRSAFRNKEEDIPHTRNNWLCYNFKEKKIVPTH
jgi:hypothetical protein